MENSAVYKRLLAAIENTPIWAVAARVKEVPDYLNPVWDKSKGLLVLVIPNLNGTMEVAVLTADEPDDHGRRPLFILPYLLTELEPVGGVEIYKFGERLLLPTNNGFLKNELTGIRVREFVTKIK